MSTFILENAMPKKAHPFGYALNSTCARRFELPTFWSVARRSIQLSYAHITVFRFCCVPHSKIYYSVGFPACQQVFLTFFKLFSKSFFENLYNFYHDSRKIFIRFLQGLFPVPLHSFFFPAHLPPS